MADDPLKHLPTPDPKIVRIKLNAAAKAGEIPKTTCRHPMAAVEQYVDDIPGVVRYQRPTNLFECTHCHQQLRLVDFNGKEASDG